MPVVCIIGSPVRASLSPAIHNAAFRAVGLPWTYVAIDVPPGAAADGVAMLERLEMAGANVTMPHKEAIVPMLARLSDDAARIGSVNTIVRSDEGWVGDTTDGAGFLAALRADGSDPRGADALVIGAGGASRAVADALQRAGASVRVVARRPERARSVAAATGATAGTWPPTGRPDLIVNATAARDGLPIESLDLGGASLVVDLVYGGPPTGLLRAARQAGVRAVDGLGMLVHQAALSFTIWTGVEAPVQVMDAAARAAL